MATFTLNWDNTLILAEPNAINQRASYRIKSVGGAYITTGFTPTNDMATSVISTSRTGSANIVYEFKIEALCTAGGPTMNDNGVIEQIVFECIDPIFSDVTSTSITVTIPTSTTDIEKIKFTLRKQGDGSLVAQTTSISPGDLGDTIAIFSGLTANTAYYIDAVYYATINGVEVMSNQTGYLNLVCGGNIAGWQVTTEAIAVPNLMFTWTKTALEAINLTSSINGSFTSVDWGDGTINTSLLHTYTLAGTYTVKIYDSTATIITLGNKLGPSVYKLTALSNIPSTVVDLNVYTNTLTSLPSLAPNTSLLKLYAGLNALTSIPNVSANVLLEELLLQDNNISGTYDFSANINLNTIELDRNSLTGLSGFNLTPLLSLLQFGDNSISVSNINNILVDLDNNGVTNGVFISTNQTPIATPTGLGATAKTNLLGKSWTMSTD